jgi:hypothetical protein
MSKDEATALLLKVVVQVVLPQTQAQIQAAQTLRDQLLKALEVLNGSNKTS